MKTPVFYGGAVVEPDTTLPDRGVIQYAGDKFLDVVKGVGAIEVGATAAAEDAARAAGWSGVADALGEHRKAATATRDTLERGKSDKGRQLSEPGKDTRGFVQRNLEGVIDYAPAMIGTALSGPAAPVVGAALFGSAGYGENREELGKEIEALTPEELSQLRRPGETDEEAKQRMYEAGIPGAAFAGGAQAVTAGLGTWAIKSAINATAAARREAASTVTDRIIAKTTPKPGFLARSPVISGTLAGAGEGAVAGAVMGAGTEYGRERAQLDAGLRDTTSAADVFSAAEEGALGVGMIGGGFGAWHGVRKAATRAAADRAKKPADPIGADTTSVASEQLNPSETPAYMPGGDPMRGPGPGRERWGYDNVPPGGEPGGEAPWMPGGERRAPDLEPLPGGVEAPHMPSAPPEGAAYMPGGEPQRGRKPARERMGYEGDLPPEPPPPEPLPGGEENPYMPTAPARGPAYMPGGAPLRGPKPARDRMGYTGEQSPADLAALRPKEPPVEAAPPVEVTPGVTPPVEVTQGVTPDALAATTAGPRAAPQKPTTSRVAAERARREANTGEPPPVEVAPVAPEAPAAPVTAGEAPARQTLSLKKAPAEAPKQPITGEAAAPIIAEHNEQRVQRAGEAWGVQAGLTEKTQARGAEAERKAGQREDAATARETTAREVALENRPGANEAPELEARAKALDELSPTPANREKLKAAVSTAIERAKQVLNDYISRAKERTGKEPMKAGTIARVRQAGPYHRYMVELNNFIMKAGKALADGKYALARELAQKHYEVENGLLKPGGIEEAHLAAIKRNEAQNVSRKTVSIDRALKGREEEGGETAGEARTRAQSEVYREVAGGQEVDVEAAVEANLKDNPLRKLTKKEREARGWLHEVEVDGDPLAEHVNGKEQPRNDEARIPMYEAMKAARAKVGRRLTIAEAADIARKHGDNVVETTYGELLKKIVPEDPFVRAIFDRVHELVKDIPVTVFSRDAMDAFGYSQGRGLARASHSYTEGRGVFRHDTLVPRTIFHEAIHAATARAVRTSPRLEYLLTRLQNIIETRHREMRYAGEGADTGTIGWERGIRDKGGKQANVYEFLSELFTRPDFAQLVSKALLTPAEVIQLRKAGYEVDAGRSIMKTLWNGFLEAIGFKKSTPDAYKVAVDLLTDAMNAEAKLQKRDIQRGFSEVGMLDTAEIANLRARDPILNRQIEDALNGGDPAPSVNRIMDTADRISAQGPEAEEAAIKYLKAINDRIYGKTEWLDEASTSAESTAPAGVVSRTVDHLKSRWSENLKDLAFKAKKTKFGTERAHISRALQDTGALARVGSDKFRTVMQKAVDILAEKHASVEDFLHQSGDLRMVDKLNSTLHVIHDPKVRDAYQQFMVDETMHGAYADVPLTHERNKHVGDKDPAWDQVRQNHDKMMQRYRDIIEGNEQLKGMREELHRWGNRMMDEARTARVQRFASRMGMVDPDNAVGRSAIAKQVLGKAKDMTAAEKAEYARLEAARGEEKFKADLNELKSVPEFTQLAGPWVPLARHGDHAVYAEYHVEPKKGVDAKRVAEDEYLNHAFDFANPADASAFIRDELGKYGLVQTGGQRIVYDKATGERAMHYTEAELEANRKFNAEAAKSGSPERRPEKNRYITAKEFADDPAGFEGRDLEHRHRVTYTPREFRRFDSERLAQEHADALSEKHGSAVRVSPVEAALYDQQSSKAPSMSPQLTRLIDRVEASPVYQAMPDSQRAAWRRELSSEAARIISNSGRRTLGLPREYVLGASIDLVRTYKEAVASHARNMAELRHQDNLDAAMKGVDDYLKGYRYENGNHTRAEQSAALELQKRVYSAREEQRHLKHLTDNVMQITSTAQLADTGYLAVNATEPMVLGPGLMAGRHGMMQTLGAIATAYRTFDIGAMAKMAFSDMRFKEKDGTTRVPSNYREAAHAMVEGQTDAVGLRALFDVIFKQGYVSRDAGFQFEGLDTSNRGLFMKGVGAVDHVLRGAVTGIEVLNRLVLATAAYRLEMRKEGATQESATQYAKEILLKGAGVYSSWNAPRITQSPWLKFAMKFKQYPLRVMNNYVEAAVNSFGSGEKASEARKQLAWMLGTQAMVAGAFGLPLGPVAGTTNAAYLLGFSDHNWEDVKTGMRVFLNDALGPTIAELVAHGGFRAINLDLASKFSHSDLVFFGSPDKQGIGNAIGSLGVWVLGAPGGWGKTFFDGISDLRKAAAHFSAGADDQGKELLTTAMGKLLMVKQARDMTEAYSKWSGGPSTRTNMGVPLGNAYSTPQAILRGLTGFRTGTEAERDDARRSERRAVTLDRTAHAGVLARATNATPAELNAIWTDIQAHYNPGRPPEMQITYGELLRARMRLSRVAATDDGLGVQLSRKHRSIAKIGEAYNTGLNQ